MLAQIRRTLKQLLIDIYDIQSVPEPSVSSQSTLRYALESILPFSFTITREEEAEAPVQEPVQAEQPIEAAAEQAPATNIESGR